MLGCAWAGCDTGAEHLLHKCSFNFIFLCFYPCCFSTGRLDLPNKYFSFLKLHQSCLSGSWYHCSESALPRGGWSPSHPAWVNAQGMLQSSPAALEAAQHLQLETRPRADLPKAERSVMDRGMWALCHPLALLSPVLNTALPVPLIPPSLSPDCGSGVTLPPHGWDTMSPTLCPGTEPRAEPGAAPGPWAA